jgi:hypothetical protein
MTTPDNIKNRVAQYKRNRAVYRESTYKEAQLRQEFIDPVFEELGWDMSNKQAYAEPYKDVVHEDAIKIAGAMKAPDYSFRIGGVRKFFLEAKRPAIDISSDAQGAHQLRRYAWSAHLAVSILTIADRLGSNSSYIFNI